MTTLVTRPKTNGPRMLRRGYEPFSFARDLLGWDPFTNTLFTDAKSGFSPAFDAVERADGYYLTADLPGVEEKDLDVTLHDGRLTVTGKREQTERTEKDNYYLYERRHGSFTRSFQLPDNIDPDTVDAQLKSGVLEIRVGKQAATKPRRIEVK